jgi:hypothetical protein
MLLPCPFPDGNQAAQCAPNKSLVINHHGDMHWAIILQSLTFISLPCQLYNSSAATTHLSFAHEQVVLIVSHMHSHPQVATLDLRLKLQDTRGNSAPAAAAPAAA